jgi:hypothetical protein
MNRKLFTNTAALVLPDTRCCGVRHALTDVAGCNNKLLYGHSDSRFKTPNFRSRAYRGPRVSR